MTERGRHWQQLIEDCGKSGQPAGTAPADYITSLAVTARKCGPCCCCGGSR